MAATSTTLVFSFSELSYCHSFPRFLRSFPPCSIDLRNRAPQLCHALAAGEPSTDPCVVLSGGGSGGHIYHSIAIADELRNVCPNSRIVFLGTATGMESNVVPSAGYEFVPVPKVLLARPFLSPLNLLLPFHLLRSKAASASVLSRLRPKVAIGTGAYVSAPVGFAAIISGIMLVIQEQHCYPGITNRVLAPYAEKIFLAFNACIKYLPREKCVVTGDPRRLSCGVSKAGARLHFFPNSEDMNVDERALVILVLGGSTGANAMNLAFLEGRSGTTMSKVLPRIIPDCSLQPFLDAMELAYAVADLVVSRASAMTCTEILTAGKPSILIPLPTASDDHQTKNAYAMADLAGAHVLTEDELDSSSLQTAINNMLGDNNLMEEMSEKARRAARPNAASHIAECILSILQ